MEQTSGTSEARLSVAKRPSLVQDFLRITDQWRAGFGGARSAGCPTPGLRPLMWGNCCYAIITGQYEAIRAIPAARQPSACQPLAFRAPTRANSACTADL